MHNCFQLNGYRFSKHEFFIPLFQTRHPNPLSGLVAHAVVLHACSPEHFADGLLSLPLRASWEQVFSNHTWPKSAPSAAKQNAYSATGSRTFWSLAKAVSHNFRPSNFPPIRDFPGDLVCKAREKGEFFCFPAYLQFHFTLFLYISGFFLSHYPCFLPHISTRKICQALHSLKVSKPPAADGVPPIVVKMCSLFGASFTSHFLSFSQAFYLLILLEAVIFPIPKCCDSTDSNNYRPTSLIYYFQSI